MKQKSQHSPEEFNTIQSLHNNNHTVWDTAQNTQIKQGNCDPDSRETTVNVDPTQN